MRISDWSSDVCSSDLRPRCAISLPLVIAARRVEPLGKRRLSRRRTLAFLRLLLQGDGLQAELVVLHCCGFELQPCAQIADFLGRYCGRQPGSELFEPLRPRCDGDRKSVVSGKSVSVRVDLGGRRLIKKKKK